MANIDLLNRVQSPDGWLTVLGLKGKSAIQELVQTREEFDKYVAEFLEKGRDVYFGVAALMLYSLLNSQVRC